MDFSYVINNLINVLIPIGMYVVLPIAVVWIYYRMKQHDTDKRTEIIMAAIEKNGDIDVQDYFNKLTPQQRPFKERMAVRLHLELLFGTMLTLFGLLAIVGSIIGLMFADYHNIDIAILFIIMGSTSLAVGVGLLMAYNSGKKMFDDVDNEQ